MKKYPCFSGVHTALVTPFLNGELDEPAFIQLINDQIAGGVNGIVPAGTTGESPTLTEKEHLRIIELAVTTANKRVLVIAGTGSNSTAKAVATTVAAEQLGADAALVVVPYYNKPSPEGLYKHFKAIADAVSIPIILYNVPGRSGVGLPTATTIRLVTDCSNIIAIKEASGSTDQTEALKAALPPHFQILSGDDALTLAFLKEGGVGVISVASNLIPSEISHLVSLYQLGHLEEAALLNDRLAPLFRDLFIESNPVPIKTALAARGRIKEELRLPLVSLTPEHRNVLLNTMLSLNL